MENLYDVVSRLKGGSSEAGWAFSEHPKIRAIIRSRINDYRRQFHWLPVEDLEDIEHGLRPRLIEIARKFELPVERNEGRVVAYFKLRIKGEADFLLKRITGMRQVADDDGNLFLKAFNQPLETIGESECGGDLIDDSIVNTMEDGRQTAILAKIFATIPPESSERIWLNCYMLRLSGQTWAEVAKSIGYTQTDFAHLTDNTNRFVSRLKDRLIRMGEEVNCRICGIYTDDTDVGICVIDTVDQRNSMIWSKNYSTYHDLDKVEAKLGDIFRQFDITYVIMNEVWQENPAHVICMRYLAKRESFVETVDGRPFYRYLSEKPNTFQGNVVSATQRRAYQLAITKKAHLECIRDRARSPKPAQRD